MGCQSQQKLTHLVTLECEQLSQNYKYASTIEKLDTISELYYKKCYDDVIKFGNVLRYSTRDKLYSVTTETVEVFFPDGTFTDYVLESHERSFLSILISLSYYAKNDPTASRVEFLKSIDESQAQLYNYGTDITILFLQATIADTLNIQIESRPFWSKIVELTSNSTNSEHQKINLFCTQRIKEIDQKINKKYKIKSLGFFPDLDWKPNFISFGQKNNYTIYSKTEFPSFCTEQQDSIVFLSTRSWLDKISTKYSHDYHPLLNVKSWVRLPVGLTYGLTTASIGGAIIISGCAIDSESRSNGELCRISIEAGGSIMSKAPDVIEYTMKPDLRHWNHIPIAFLFEVKQDSSNVEKSSFNYDIFASPCFQNLPEQTQKERRTLL